MEGDKPRVEKLRDADNWQQWQFVVSTLLDSEDALGVCDGTFVKPESTDQNYDQQIKKWIKADRLARKIIVTTVEAKPLQLLMNCENAREMWVKLHSVYDMKSDESLGLIQKQFFELKWDSSLNIAGHISKLEQMASKMKKLNSPIPESMLMARILSILPVKFNHFHSAWESMDSSKRNIETLTTRLMTEELRLQKGESEVDELTTALVTKAKLHPKKFFKKGKECFTCGKTGHFRRDCPGCAKCGSKRHLQKDCLKNASAQMQTDDSGEKQAFVGVGSAQKDSDIWLIDSGATNHITNRRDWFDEFKVFSEPQMIRVGNGESIAAYGSGHINVETYANGTWLAGTLYDVLYVPKIARNLFSVKVAAKRGVDFVVSNNGKNCMFLRNNKVVAVGAEAENLYRIILRVVAPSDKTADVLVSMKTESSSDTLNLWHERLGHQNNKHVQVFMKRFGHELINDNKFCDGCAYGKNHRQAFRDRKEERAGEIRELIHSDVCGPMDVESLGGKRYYLLFKDDFSKYRVIYFIRNKSEVYEKLEKFLNEIKTQFTDHVKEILHDGGKEYVNRNVKCLLSKMGIKQTVTVPYTPEQNGFVERENRTIVESARAMLYSKSYLPKNLWAEAMNTAVYILNRTGPTRIPGKTPIEIWSGKKPKVSHLRIFGTECFVHIPKEKRHKLDKKSYKGYLVGYTENVKGYRVWIPERNDVIVSRDVIFKDEVLQPTEVSVESTIEKSKEVAQEEKHEENITQNDLPKERNL